MFVSQYESHVTFDADTDVGRVRQDQPNQDTVGTYEDYCDDLARLALKGKLFVVADGMGGMAGGKEASAMAVEVVCRSYYADPDPEIVPSLDRAIQAANSKIYQYGHAHVELRGLGTTIVIAVIREQTLVVGNVGDSRAYLLRQGELRQLSTDHTAVQEQVREGLLTPEAAAIHPRRHLLSKNLGYWPQANPDFHSQTISAHDTILLCSDGLWGVVADAELAVVLRQHSSGDAVQRLIDLANEQGGPDNISAVVLHVDRVGSDPSFITTDHAEQLLAQLESNQGTLAEMETVENPMDVLMGSPVKPQPSNSACESQIANGLAYEQLATQPPRMQRRWLVVLLGMILLLIIGAVALYAGTIL